MKNPYLLLIFLSTALSYKSYSQNYTPQVVPPSPEAAAFGKYGEVPVGTYTGVPEIEIPLYEIQTGPLSHSISLSYHGSGVKVEDMSSNVGLGWTLNVGGVITRAVQGLPDDVGNGFWTSANTVPENFTGISNEDLKVIARNKQDALPDIYYYNFGKYSGQIMFTKQKVPYTIPYQNFKMYPTFSGNAITSWDIRTEEGFTYTFSATEQSETLGGCYDSRSGGITSNTWISSTYKSAWYVTKIQAPSGDAINFTYGPLPTHYSFTVMTDYQKHITLETSGCISQAEIPNYNVSCSTQISITGVQLSSISFRGGSIAFDNSSRVDLPGASRVTGFTVSSDGNIVKKFLFDNNSLFNSTCTEQECKRMKLSSVTEIGRNNVPLKPHIFNYNTEPLPSRFSYDVDYWGYYNKRNNQFPHPEFVNYLKEPFAYNYFEGAVRKPDPEAAKAGVLTQIIYPTGGYTNFEFELNETTSEVLPNKTAPGAVPVYQLSGNSSAEEAGQTFNVQGYFDNGQFVEVTYQTSGCSTNPIPSLENLCPYVKIKKTAGTAYETVLKSGTLVTNRIFLPNGTYQLRGGNAGTGQSYSIQVRVEKELSTSNKFGGGLRIKSIVDSDGISNYNQRSYDYNDTDGITTGRIVSYPKTYYNDPHAWYQSCGDFQCVMVPEFILSSASNTTLGTTRGGFVGYGKVTERRDGNGTAGGAQYGKSEYFYTSQWKGEKELNTSFNDIYPYAPPWGPAIRENEYMRGFLVNKIDYKYNPGATPYFTKVLENPTVYKTIGSGVEIKGLKVAITNDNQCAPFQDAFNQVFYFRYGGVAYVPDYSTEIKYNDDGTVASQIKTTKTFNPVHLQMTNELVTLQDNPLWTRETKLKYAPDYAVASPSGGMASTLFYMTSSNNITPIIEKQVWDNQNGVNALIDGQINIYKSNAVDIDTVHLLKTKAETPITSYTPSAVTGGVFTYDRSKFRPVTRYEIFDAPGRNLKQVTGPDGITRSYLWGHSDLYPIAEVVNAKYSSIAYTSFEESVASTNGNWSWSGTGTRNAGGCITGVYNFTGQVETVNLMPAGQYTLSLWAFPLGTGVITITGGSINIAPGYNWTPYTATITLAAPGKISVNTGSNIYIDEVRLYPVNAAMKSFVYTQLVGMRSSNDETNYPFNYLYDDNNRLSMVQDFTGNVIKKFSYNVRGYTGTVAGAGINSTFTFAGTFYPGGTVTFTATNTDTNARYDWDFGDATISSNGGRVVSHAYAAAGNYIVRLKVSKASDESFTDKAVLIKAPNPAGPTITINGTPSTAGIISGLPPKQKYSVSATATPSDGTKTGQTFTWRAMTPGGSITETVSGGTSTSPTNTLVFATPLPTGTQPNCAPIPGTSFVLVGTVNNSVEHSVSDPGQKTFTVMYPRTLAVSPTTKSFGYTASSNVTSTFTVTGADSNITATTTSSWIHITSLVQCGSFNVWVSANTSTGGRTGYVNISASNGTLQVSIQQDGTPPTGGGGGGGGTGCPGEGCVKVNGTCRCP